MTTADIESQTRAFLARYIRNQEIAGDQDLFASGLVNSLFAMQLVLFVEKQFGIRVENQDLDLKNFRTLNAIVELVQRKSTTAATV